MSEPAKKRGGQQPGYKLTEAVSAKIQNALEKGASINEASLCAGLHRSQIYTWTHQGRTDKNAGKETKFTVFLDMVDQARESCLSRLNTIEWDIATDEDQPAGARLRAIETIRSRIDKKGPQPVRVELTGSVAHQHSGTVEHQHAEVLSDAALREADAESLTRLLAEVTRVTTQAFTPEA